METQSARPARWRTVQAAPPPVGLPGSRAARRVPRGPLPEWGVGCGQPMWEFGQLSVQLTFGAGLLPVQLPRKPKVADPPGASAPFQPTSRAVAVLPLWLISAFHDWLICWPEPKVSCAVQAWLAVVP